VRVIAATNRDLESEVAAGRFRADLYFRLNVFPIIMPPLREREGDVEPLVHFFVDRFARELGKRIEGLSRASLDRLVAYHWPGNVRELSNLIERAVVLATGPILDVGVDLTAAAAPAPRRGDGAVPLRCQPMETTLEEVERQHMLAVLAQRRWVIEGQAGAAAALGLRPSTLRSRMKKLGVRKPAITGE
jgi:transcriptional regulator with GAF, ATPase, and Fis domain